MSQTEFAVALEAASKAECVCCDRSRKTLIEAAKNGCVECCQKYINEAGKVVKGTTALVEAATKGHLDVVRLLLPLEGRLKDRFGKFVICRAAEYSRNMFDEVFNVLGPRFVAAVKKMRQIQCICSFRSNNIKEAVGNLCMRCGASLIHGFDDCSEELVAQVNAVADHRRAFLKIMTFLQAKLNILTDYTELMFALRNNLYEESVLLLDEQRNMRDSQGRKASAYAASVHNPRLWALFPEDISPEYTTDLEVAHSAKCVCDGQSKELSSAVQQNCPKCCTGYISTCKVDTSNSTELMNVTRISDIRIVRLLRHVQAGIQDKEGKSALMFVAKLGNVLAIQFLAHKEAGLRDKTGRTALVYALLGGQLEAAKMLLPFERNVRDYSNRAADNYAFYTENPETWRLFKPDITPEEGNMRHTRAISECICFNQSKYFVEAAKNDCLQCCIRFKEQASQFVNDKTALMETVQWGNTDIMRLVMPKDALLQNQFKLTASMCAALYGKLNVVKLLLPLKKDLKDRDQRSVCTSAAQSKHEPTLEYVLREMWPGAYEYLQEARNSQCTCGGKSFDLKDATELGCLRCTASFIYDVGRNKDAPVIMGATKFGHVDIVKLLLPFEADMREQGGMTALILAAQYGHSDIVKLLIPHEAKMQTEYGTTALMKAAKHGHTEIVKLLIPFEVGLVSNSGDTALTMAVIYHQRECFDILRLNLKELETSKIPYYMLALYDGDIKVALEHQSEWTSVFEQKVNIVNFALLGGNLRFIRTLTRDPEARQRLSRPNGWLYVDEDSMAVKLLYSFENQPNVSHILGMVCSAAQSDRSELLSKALFEYPGPAAKLLQPFCTIMETDVGNSICVTHDKAHIAHGLRAIKNAGALRGIEKRHLDLLCGQDLASNPLKLKQLELARKQTTESQQRVFKEVEAEASFNRALFLEAGNVLWKSIAAQRSITVRSAGVLRQKTTLNAAGLHASYLYLIAKVQEMTDE